MDNPLVSIIIPAHNAEKYIEQTILCAISQSWSPKEIIVVNDGSSDASLEIMKKYESNITIHNQEKKGASAARNRGLSLAHGEFIQFLDADDLLSFEKIEKQVHALQHDRSKIAVCPTVHFAEKVDPNKCQTSAYEDSFLKSADPLQFLINLYGGNSIAGSMIQPNAWLTPKHIIEKAGPWDETISLDDDGEFFCRVVLKTTGVIVVNDVVNYYRKNLTNSLSGKKSKSALLSKYRSIQLKHSYLNQFNDNRVFRTTCKNLMELLMATYPEHTVLSKQILKDIENFGGTTYVPIIGGPVIELIKNALGWKMARQLQHHFNKYVRR
jgi:glycosyltransferase involved in cell wall biosynthesis